MVVLARAQRTYKTYNSMIRIRCLSLFQIQPDIKELCDPFFFFLFFSPRRLSTPSLSTLGGATFPHHTVSTNEKPPTSAPCNILCMAPPPYILTITPWCTYCTTCLMQSESMGVTPPHTASDSKNRLAFPTPFNLTQGRELDPFGHVQVCTYDIEFSQEGIYDIEMIISLFVRG